MLSEFAGEWGKLRLFKKAFDSTQLGVTITDITGKIIYTNPVDAKMHGYTVEELQGQDVRIFAPTGTWRPLTPEKLKEIKTLKRESVNIRKDGSAFAVQLLSDVVIDADGNPVGVVTICEDITERIVEDEKMQQAHTVLDKRIQQRSAALTETIGFLEKEINDRKRVVKSLRDSEERYRQLFEINPKPMVVYDLESLAFLDVNEAAIRHYGYSKEEFRSRTIDDISLFEEVPETLDRILNDTDNPCMMKMTRHRLKDGSIIFAEINVQPLVLEGKKAGLITIHDLTERECLLVEFEKVIQCFLNFGTEYTENINLLTALCGEYLGADCAYYIRLDSQKLYSIGQWPGQLHSLTFHNPEEHYCYEIVKKGGDKISVTHNLSQTAYAHVGFSGAACVSKTFMGKAIKNNRGICLGVLCVAYQKKITPTETQKRFMEIIAAAISVEEERGQAQKKHKEISS